MGGTLGDKAKEEARLFTSPMDFIIIIHLMIE
jgi:hypothetical protein